MGVMEARDSEVEIEGSLSALRLNEEGQTI